jgi:hypothetical protein
MLKTWAWGGENERAKTAVKECGLLVDDVI